MQKLDDKAIISTTITAKTESS